MNDFTHILLAFGRGIIKILISTLVGFGVALLVIGITTAGRQDLWHGPPPGELFMGIGAGLLSGGGTLLALFFLPWFLKRPVERAYMEEPLVLARPASRPHRHDIDDAPVRTRPEPPRLNPDDSSLPTARPPSPPQDEPGRFFEK